MLKRIISSLLAITSLFCICTVSMASTEKVAFVNSSIAQQIATNFVIARIQATDSNLVENTFPFPFSVVLSDTMYDLNGDISAYKFDILDENAGYSGYVIAGAQNRFLPIIEYGVGNSPSFLDVAKNELEATQSSKLYYVGGFEYYIETPSNEHSKTAIYNVATGNRIAANTSELNKLIKTSSVDDLYSNIWNNSLVYASQHTRSGNTIITDPFDYETGYDSYNINYIDSALQPDYITDSDYPFSIRTNACSAIAATNLFLYHYEENDKTSLMYNGSWYNSFEKIREYANHIDGEYVTVRKLTQAINSYVDAQGYTLALADFTDSPSESLMTGAVANDSPQILLVNEHSDYEDHFLLTLGYEKFFYSYPYDTPYVTYFVVADGWNNGYRYICYDENYFTSVIDLEF